MYSQKLERRSNPGILTKKKFQGISGGILGCLIIFMASCSETKIDNQYYPDGKLSRTTEFKNGKKHGTMVDYFSNGTIKSIRNFANDKQEGRSVYYYNNGTLKEVQYYSQGLQEQADSIWDENGVLTTVMHFRNGLKNGKLLKLDSLGNVKFSAAYEQDSLVEVNGVILPR